jgi:uncharacterized delta-60 repeat protein
MEHLERRCLLSAGAVDPGYLSGFEGGLEFCCNLVQAQPDGKSLHAGLIYAGDHGLNPDKRLWRQLPSGATDKTFGDQGSVLFDNWIADFAIDRNGKIVVALGGVNPGPLITRLNANGTVDNSFGSHGKVSLSRHPYYEASLAIDADGKIVVGGYDNDRAFIYRLQSNGARDNSFGTAGLTTFSPDPGRKQITISDIDIRRKDNRIVAVGTNSGGSSPSRWDVWVLAPNGKVEWRGNEPLFSNNTDEGASRVMVDSDGSILVGGSVDGANDSVHGELVRYPAPRSHKQVQAIDLGNKIIKDLAIAKDGKVLASLATDFEAGEVRRFNTDLSTDNSFGTNGGSSIDFNPSAMAVQPDGKIIIDGQNNFYSNWETYQFQTIRLMADDTPVQNPPPPATLRRRTLLISGTVLSDYIKLTKKGKLIKVFLNSGHPLSFAFSKVRRIVINAGDGSDDITIAKSLPPAVIDGGDGNDSVEGRRKKDKLLSIEIPFR